MAKALITMQGGAIVTLEGTQEEVAALLARFENVDRQRAVVAARPTGRSEKRRATSLSIILELIDAGFFATPKGLGAIKQALEERGHFYPVTTLSPLMLRLVKKKQLRRLKQGNLWVYVE